VNTRDHPFCLDSSLELYRGIDRRVLKEIADQLSLENPEVKQREIRTILSHLPKDSQKSARILEVGCGYGRLAEEFLSMEGVSYTGIDFIEEYVDFCRRRFGQNETFILGDFQLTSIDSTFDVIVFPWLILSRYSFAHQKQMLTKAAEFLKSGQEAAYIAFDWMSIKYVQFERVSQVTEEKEGQVVYTHVPHENKDATMPYYAAYLEHLVSIAESLNMDMQTVDFSTAKQRKDYVFFILRSENVG